MENTPPVKPPLSDEEIEKIEEDRKAAEASFRKAHSIPEDVSYEASSSSSKGSE
jgi:hypothetical protein